MDGPWKHPNWRMPVTDDTCCVALSVWRVKNRQIHRDTKQMSGCPGETWRVWEGTANGKEFLGRDGKMKVLVAQSCPALCNPVNGRPPGSSVHRILQARILEGLAVPFSRGSSWPTDRTQVSCIAGRFFTIWATRGRGDENVLRLNDGKG